MFQEGEIKSFNPFPQFAPDIMHMCIQNRNLAPRLEVKVNEMIRGLYCRLEEALPEYSSKTDYTIYYGYCGTALASLLLYEKTKDNKYFLVAKDLTNMALANLAGKSISFLKGDAGPLALGILINMHEEKIETADSLIGKLIALGEKENPFNPIGEDLLDGRAGYIYALIFVDQNLPEPVIPEMTIRKHVEKILYAGFQRARKAESLLPLEFTTHDQNFTGAAHGFAGILYILLICQRYLTSYEMNCIIRPSLNSLFATRLKSYNFSVTSDSHVDELVQWCHGASGFVHLLSLASVIYNCPAYLKMAFECGELIWKRGLLKKGYSICHGVAGNAYIFMYLYKITGDESYFYKAACFADWCTRYPHNEGLKPDWPYSLFQGMAGILHFLVEVQDPDRAYFPGFELKISE